jgi:hypothetical protein
MIGAMPMETLAAFPDTGFDRAMLDGWLAKLRSA